MKFTDDLALGYKILFDSMIFRKGKQEDAERIADKILANKSRYENVLAVAKKQYPQTKVPWYFIGLVHLMECDLSFTRHLHNGDPLSKRTVRVPAGRPAKGNPPFTFVESAVDALYITGVLGEQDWTIAKMLYRLEGYNGFGYTLYRKINSPYLWAGSQHYTKGKYVADGKYDPDAVSTQLGVALVLKYFFGVLITTTDINIRSGSGIEFPKVSKALIKGTRVKKICEADGWTHVEVISTGLKGWVASPFLTNI